MSGESRYVTVFCPYCRAQPHKTCMENTPELDRAPVVSTMYEVERQDGLWAYVCPKCSFQELHGESIAP